MPALTLLLPVTAEMPSARNLVDPLSLLAAQRAANFMRFWLESMGCPSLEASQALRLPEWKLEGSLWPFESRLMAEVVRAVQAGEPPAQDDVMLLTLCSSSGEIEPYMQPARRESQDNIQRLCAALQRLVHEKPEAGLYFRACTAKTRVWPAHPLYIEQRPVEVWGQQQQWQAQQEEQPPALDASAGPGPADPAASVTLSDPGSPLSHFSMGEFGAYSSPEEEARAPPFFGTPAAELDWVVPVVRPFPDFGEDLSVGIWADEDEDLPEDIHPGLLAHRRRAMAREVVETIDPALIFQG